ncbi:MAG: 1-(5-phosphoribosyl)-5-[(5-phosphoribosylamino)methylideneamino]imidazole-4-carboxamide isomerase [Clostridia bacterium]|nr:1-(5-phosphoribosyl)-5-[(5-phosphoribosylamino)methylideneamino]imidazole-4-carboxamide isomerase [Clostridia bacterium]
MIIYPAIDLFDHKAVRLYKGDYAQMTVYSDNPVEIAYDFASQGATHLHLVDLEGAKSGDTPNLSTVRQIVSETHLFTEVGGGVRSMAVIDAYLNAGLSRVILGTAAVTDEAFLREAVKTFGDKIAVGADFKDGYAAIRGWTETSALQVDTFVSRMQDIGVKTMICTDISRDGAMQGTNRSLYQHLSETYAMDFIASGGVSALEDVRALSAMRLHGAIIGKAYYTKAINIREAIEVSK